jgi:hypothetical protein
LCLASGERRRREQSSSPSLSVSLEKNTRRRHGID